MSSPHIFIWKSRPLTSNRKTCSIRRWGSFRGNGSPTFVIIGLCLCYAAMKSGAEASPCCEMLRNAVKCCEMRGTAGECCEMLGNAGECKKGWGHVRKLINGNAGNSTRNDSRRVGGLGAWVKTGEWKCWEIGWHESVWNLWEIQIMTLGR